MSSHAPEIQLAGLSRRRNPEIRLKLTKDGNNALLNIAGMGDYAVRYARTLTGQGLRPSKQLKVIEKIRDEASRTDIGGNDE